MSLVLTISDAHFPYHHEDIFDFLNDLKKETKPDEIVLLGDELELNGMSFHDHDPNMPSAREEFELGKECLKKLYKLFPEVKACTSNHTSRGFRRAFKYGIPSQFLKGYKELLGAPRGWNWRDYWEIDKVLYLHGEGFSGKNAAITAAEKYRQSVVIGHIHAWAGVQYIKSRQGQIFGANAGCLIDSDAIAFNYGKHFPTKPIIGTCIIENGVRAHFCPMKL